MDAVKTISVLGCGWLGIPLASRLILDGFTVKGSTTTTDKMAILQSHGIKPYVLRFQPHLIDQPDDFFASDVFFVNIPFRRDLEDPAWYQKQIGHVMDQVTGACIHPWVIFASSTLVYPQQQTVCVEDQPLTPDHARAQILYDIEQGLLKDNRMDATIIRFAGLYGPGRLIKNFMAKATIRSAEGRVNLIHLEDCIGIITAIIHAQRRGEVFNAVSDGHPTRQELYSSLARSHGLPNPVFGLDSKKASKIVSNTKIKAMLQYRLVHPDPLMD